MTLSDKDGFCPKLVVTAWAFMECLLFGGLLYGWGSINFVLKQEGIYVDLCPSDGALNVSQNRPNILDNTSHSTDPVQVCAPQDEMMALCFTIGSAFFNMGCAVFGYVSYKFGTRATRLMSFAMFFVGSLLMAFISNENPWLMFPGLAFLGVGGLPLLVTNIQVSFLFENRSSLVGLLCGAFDVSAAIMLLVKIASENGFSRRNMFFVITALHMLVLISTFFFLPRDFIKKRESKQGQTVVTDESLVANGEDHQKNAPIQGDTEKTDVSTPSLCCCVKNPMFLTHTVWICLLQLRFFYFIGTLNPYLNRVLHGDQNKVSYFTNVCYYTMMGGLLTSIISGFVYDWQKRLFKEGKTEQYRKVAPAAVPQGIASLLGIILSGSVLITNPQALYVTFIVMTLYRSFLYSLGAAFLGEVFPEKYFGMLYGIMIVSGGIFGLLQYALFTWTEAYTGGAHHVDIFLFGVVVLSLLHPIYILVSSLKKERAYKKMGK